MRAIEVELLRHLDLCFPPDGSTGPSWSERPERDDLFKLFLKASRYERLQADSMLGFMREAWLPKRKALTDEAEAEAYALGEAWGEWAYCKEMLDRGG